jgi:DNA-binding GntR family transcriptional regulator
MSAAHDSLLYARVETVLAGEITDGDLKVGDQLPTEDSLIARFAVSRITVRRAAVLSRFAAARVHSLLRQKSPRTLKY